MAFETILGSGRGGQGAFGRELGDASWRRWFDRLQDEGVDRIGAFSSFVPMGVATPDPERFGYSSRQMRPALLSTADESFQTPVGPTEAPMPESHESFTGRRKSIEDAGLRGIRKVTGR